MPQHMAPLSPETRHRLPNRRVIRPGMLVHISRISDLGDGCGCDEVDLAMREGF